MIKVLHVISHVCAGMGGSIRAALQIADAAQGDDVQCKVIGSVANGKSRTTELLVDFPSLEVKCFGQHFPRHFFASIGMWRWLKRNIDKFDVVHSHGVFNFPYLYAWKAAVTAKKPLVLTPHNSLDPYDIRKHEWWKRKLVGPLYVRKLTTDALAIHCTAQLEAERLDRLGGRAPASIIPYPVKDPNPSGECRSEGFRRAHGFRDGDFVLLFLSRIDSKKGLDLLLRAMEIIVREAGDVKLAVVGDGDPETVAEYRNLTAGLALEEHVKWCGFLNGAEKLAAYRECDLFALPSYNENFGLVVVEALYCGTPVLISSEVYIWPNLKRRNAVEVCAPSVSEVVEALRRLIRSRELRTELSAQGPRAAAAEFGWNEVGERFREMYREVAKGRGGGA
jgi:glycosyltransferase involved in cell wall biosynthesis